MSEARESDNLVTQAMNELQGMRGVNQTLRAPQQESPPLTDEDMIEQFRRDTGYIINSNGEVIGQDPNWKQPGVPTLPPPAAAPAPEPKEEEVTPLFGLMRKRGIQIDLQRGTLTIDGSKHTLDEREVAQLARFAIEVRARELSKDLAFLQKSFGVTDLIKEEQAKKPTSKKKGTPDGQGGEATEAQGAQAPVDGLGEGGEA